MKTFRKFMMAFIAVALVGLATSCEQEDEESNGGGSNAMLTGTWTIESVMVGGQEMSQMVQNAQIIFNANGSGIMIIMGGNYNFQYIVSDSTITVNTGEETINCTILEMTSRRCVVTSQNMSFPGIGQIGAATITLVKQSGGNSDPVDSNSYSEKLVGTWLLDGLNYNGQDLSEMLPQNMYLVFYANGTGVLNDNGETQNNGFNWEIDGDVIYVTISHDNDQTSFTIEEMTDTQCTFYGNHLDMADMDLEGDIRLHMTKTRL